MGKHVTQAKHKVQRFELLMSMGVKSPAAVFLLILFADIDVSAYGGHDHFGIRVLSVSSILLS